MKTKKLILLTTIILSGLIIFTTKCSLDKSKLSPRETNGFTSEDIDKGQNNLYGIYPHVIDIEIEPTGADTQPPWIFYVRFDHDMDTSLTPEVTLEEITGDNQTSGVNAIDTASVRWTEGKTNELTFKTGTNFKVICNPGPPVQYCDNYLLTIKKENTRSILGIEMDGNWNNGNVGDDYINAPSDFVNRLDGPNSIDNLILYQSATIPQPLPATYIYDLSFTNVSLTENNWFLTPTLSDASNNGYLKFNFGSPMNLVDITNSSIEIKDASGNVINGVWYVDTNADGAPDTPAGNAPSTSAGNCNSYYYSFFFRPEAIQTGGTLGLGRYTAIVHCNSIHKIEMLNDTTCGIYQKPYTCNDFVNDGPDNDVIFEFYVTSDGAAPSLPNRVWGVYTTNDTGPFGANEIKPHQAFVLFQTPDPKDNLMDTTTLIPQNLSLLVGGDPVTVTTSVEERYFRCAKSHVWVINAPENLNLNFADLTISYRVKDKAGNTLDGNGDSFYELSANDNFNDPALPYDGISDNNPPANYVQVKGTYTQGNSLPGYTIGQNQVFIVFDTPAESDDRMNTGSLTADDLQLSGAGTGNCTCTCPGGNCAGDVTLNPVEDTTNFPVPTTVWQVTFNNPAGCNVRDCTLTIRGGSPTAAGGRPTDICGNWLYPNYTQNNLP